MNPSDDALGVEEVFHSTFELLNILVIFNNLVTNLTYVCHVVMFEIKLPNLVKKFLSKWYFTIVSI